MTTVAAQRLKMGSTEYFLASLTAGELVARVRTAEEVLHDWDNLSIEDRIQRNINWKRLLEEIVPYLAGHPDRFFGSIIVLLDGDVEFESLEKLQTVGGVYALQSEKIGFLTVKDGNWIALDGQHRLVALRELITGSYEGKQLPGIMNDDVAVIFVRQESTEKTRRIFNKVNRYARSTSRSDNLVLSEDDGYAIISRRLFMGEGGPLHVRKGLGDDFVNWKNSTISGRSLQFTTISALSLIVADICEAHGLHIDEKTLGGVAPAEEQIIKGYDLSSEWIEVAFDAYAALTEVRRKPALLPDARIPSEPYSLLLKPAGQISLFRAARLARLHIGPAFDIEHFMKASSKINWSVESDIWENILVLGKSRILAKKTNYDDAALLILWFCYGKNLPNWDDVFKQIELRWKLANPDKPLPTLTL